MLLDELERDIEIRSNIYKTQEENCLAVVIRMITQLQVQTVYFNCLFLSCLTHFFLHVSLTHVYSSFTII